MAQALATRDWTRSIYKGVDRSIERADDMPAQIKLAFIPKGMAVSFSTQNAYVAPNVPTVLYGTSPTNLAQTATGPNGQTYGTLYFHTVLLENLPPRTIIYYSVVGTSSVLQFTTAGAPGRCLRSLRPAAVPRPRTWPPRAS